MTELCVNLLCLTGQIPVNMRKTDILRVRIRTRQHQLVEKISSNNSGTIPNDLEHGEHEVVSVDMPVKSSGLQEQAPATQAKKMPFDGHHEDLDVAAPEQHNRLALETHSHVKALEPKTTFNDLANHDLNCSNIDEVTVIKKINIRCD